MLQGVPAIYYHSLLGSENDIAGLNASGSIAVLTVKTGFRHHASGISHARIPTSEDLCRTNDITAHSPTTSRVLTGSRSASPYTAGCAIWRQTPPPDRGRNCLRYCECHWRITNTSLTRDGDRSPDRNPFNGVCELAGWQTIWIHVKAQPEA